MIYLLLISTLVTCYIYIITAQTTCSTSNGKSEKCVSIFSCNQILKLVSSANADDPVILNNHFCGIDMATKTLQVCCPSDGCSTPDGTQGTCVDLQLCPQLTEMLEPRPTIAAIKHVHGHTCEGTKGEGVCCSHPTPASTSSSESTDIKETSNISYTSEIDETRNNNETNESEETNETSEPKCQLNAYPPHPNSDCCGYNTNTYPKIIGGEAAKIDDYPWLALLEYEVDGVLALRCGGVLISGQYVLTARHCVVGKDMKPVNVILGEYDTKNSGPDCVLADGGNEDCTDGAVSIPIKNIIYHPYDNSTPVRNKDDIALVKMARIVQYTDFIRPICLPTDDFTSKSAHKEYLYAAGWGMTEGKFISNIKQHVLLPYVTNEDCQSLYSVQYSDIQLWNGQICAGGIKGKDSCRGDSGGPLMRLTGNQYELVGVVSFGPYPCGKKDIPGVYTKIYQYKPWIYTTIKNL